MEHTTLAENVASLHERMLSIEPLRHIIVHFFPFKHRHTQTHLTIQIEVDSVYLAQQILILYILARFSSGFQLFATPAKVTRQIQQKFTDIKMVNRCE